MPSFMEQLQPHPCRPCDEHTWSFNSNFSVDNAASSRFSADNYLSSHFSADNPSDSDATGMSQLTSAVFNSSSIPSSSDSADRNRLSYNGSLEHSRYYQYSLRGSLEQNQHNHSLEHNQHDNLFENNQQRDALAYSQYLYSNLEQERSKGNRKSTSGSSHDNCVADSSDEQYRSNVSRRESLFQVFGLEEQHETELKMPVESSQHRSEAVSIAHNSRPGSELSSGKSSRRASGSSSLRSSRKSSERSLDSAPEANTPTGTSMKICSVFNSITDSFGGKPKFPTKLKQQPVKVSESGSSTDDSRNTLFSMLPSAFPLSEPSRLHSLDSAMQRHSPRSPRRESLADFLQISDHQARSQSSGYDSQRYKQNTD